MTLEQWYEVASEITEETEKRMRKSKQHAKGDVIATVVKKHKLLFVELAPDGRIFGLVEPAGSCWGLLVGVSDNQYRVLVYAVESPDDKNWSPEKLQLIYWETENKRIDDESQDLD